MLNTKLNEKSALARLLATENLSVQYSAKYPTAFFDLNTRTIHIPLIPNLDEDILDLFEGHEVGHARETPAEGFHSAINENGEINNTLKTYLNVIEDIRIERKIKDEYPGLRRSFANAYKKLVNMNFFGNDIQSKINKMAFIDRLNVEAKVGAYVLVDFDDEEKALVEEAYSLETWDEVVGFAKKLIGRQSQLNKKASEPSGLPQQAEKSEGSKVSSPDAKNKTNNEQSNDPLEDSKDEKSEDDSPQSSDQQDESDDQSDSSGSDEPADEVSDDSETQDEADKDGADDDVAPSETDQTFRQKESEMFAENAKKHDRYSSDAGASITIGKYNLDEYIVSANKLTHFIDSGARTMFDYHILNNPSIKHPFGSYDEFINCMATEHRNDNLAYINFLVKEFEMRKNARILNRGKVSKSGKIDVARLHKYRLSEDIFKRVVSYPEGKNHGMIMYMDLSGSMASTIGGVFNQVLILSEFCKKVNIPFRVYGFSDSETSNKFIQKNINPEFGKIHSDKREGAYRMKHGFHLKEYISSELNARDYKMAFNNILMLKSYFEAYYEMYRGRYRSHVPDFSMEKYNQIYRSLDLTTLGQQLSSTPLNDTIVLSQQISNEFVAKYNIENMVNIFMSDGEDDQVNNILYYGETYQCGIRDGYINSGFKNQSLINHHSGIRYIVKPKECRYGFSTYHLLKMARKVTGARYIGYYLTDSTTCLFNAACHDVAADSKIDWKTRHNMLKSKFRKDKFVLSKTYGYNDYFYISNKGTINDDEEDDEWFDTLSKRQDGSVSDKSLTKGFIDKQTKRQLNRILLVHFGKALAEAA